MSESSQKIIFYFAKECLHMIIEDNTLFAILLSQKDVKRLNDLRARWLFIEYNASG